VSGARLCFSFLFSAGDKGYFAFGVSGGNGMEWAFKGCYYSMVYFQAEFDFLVFLARGLVLR